MVTSERLDRLAQQALEAAPPAKLSLTDIANRAETRRRRSTALRSGAGVVAIVVAVALGWSLQDNDADRLQVAAVDEATGGTVELNDVGIWPAGAGASDPTTLAEDFARQVLGWQDATVSADPARPGDPTWVTIQDPSSGTQLRALAVPAADIEHWWFVQIGSGLIYGPGAEGLRVDLASPPAGASQVEVYAATETGTRRFQGPVDSTTTSIELTGIADRSDVSSILILYENSDGKVLAVAGGVIDP
jgi:hypothetical protein